MKKITQEKLKEILEKHQKWLNGEECGERADLTRADLRWADLTEADLTRADLRWADLRWANLTRANLTRADLTRADLTEANLRWANLRWANLTRANLTRADLTEANLRWADLDLSAFPLWCGGLDIHIDDRLAIQLLYHLIRNVLFSKNTSKTLKKALSGKTLIGWANKFHRTELPRIEVPEKKESKE